MLPGCKIHPDYDPVKHRNSGSSGYFYSKIQILITFIETYRTEIKRMIMSFMKQSGNASVSISNNGERIFGVVIFYQYLTPTAPYPEP
jgi:hypothetical protein